MYEQHLSSSIVNLFLFEKEQDSMTNSRHTPVVLPMNGVTKMMMTTTVEFCFRKLMMIVPQTIFLIIVNKRTILPNVWIHTILSMIPILLHQQTFLKNLMISTSVILTKTTLNLEMISQCKTSPIKILPTISRKLPMMLLVCVLTQSTLMSAV